MKTFIQFTEAIAFLNKKLNESLTEKAHIYPTYHKWGLIDPEGRMVDGNAHPDANIHLHLFKDHGISVGHDIPKGWVRWFEETSPLDETYGVVHIETGKWPNPIAIKHAIQFVKNFLTKYEIYMISADGNKTKTFKNSKRAVTYLESLSH